MKIQKFLLAAAVVILSAACQDQIENPVEKSNISNVKLIPVTFTAGEEESKTTLGENNNIVWEDGDKICVLDNSVICADYSSFEATSSGLSTAFSGLIGEDATTFYALYPYDENAQSTWMLDDECAMFSTALAKNQNARLAGLPANTNIAIAKADNNKSFAFHNVCGLVKFTLEREDIAAITITPNGDNALALAGGIDLTINLDGSVTDIERTETTDNAITVYAEDEDTFTPGTYYVCALPGDYAGGITVTFMNSDTEIAEISSDATLTITAGKIRNLGTIDANIDFGSGDSDKYARVTSGLTDWRGDYLIAYSSTIFMDGSLDGGTTGVGGAQTHVNPEGHISADESEVDTVWGDRYYVTIEAIDDADLSKGYVIKSHSATTPYFYQTSNKNGMASNDNKDTAASYPITIEFNDQNDIDLALGGKADGAILHYNKNSGNTGEMFRFYKDGGQENIYLYKRTSPVPAEVVNVTSVSLDKTEASIFVTQTLTLTATVSPANATNKEVSWTSSDETVATVNSDGVVTALTVGSTTITATTADGFFTAECNVTVNPVPVYNSLAELIEHEPTTGGSPVTVTLTDDEIESIFVSAKGDRCGVYIDVDDDHQIEIFCYGVPDDWVSGGTLSGTLVNCIWQEYKSTWELCPESWEELEYTAPAGVVLYNITVDTNISNGNVEPSKPKAEEGETITVTVTPATGYQLSTLTYNGNDITDAKSFEMPAADVSISATFTEIPIVDYSGTYAILAKRTEGNYWYMTSDLGTAATKRFQAVDSELTTLPESVEILAASVWTISKSENGYVISTQGGTQISWESGNSAILSSEGRILTISPSNGNAVNISFVVSETETRTLALNSNNNYFAFYTGSGAKDLYLVPATVVAPTYYTITVNNDDTNGSVSADKLQAAAGETVTLSNTPATGYELDSYSVVDASNNSVTVTNGKFTMPASSVTVSATFKTAEGGQGGSGKYVKVTSTADLTDGKYLIVYEGGNVALNGALTSDVASNTVAVTISNNEIASSTAVDAAAVTFKASDGSFLGGGGKYIGHTGSSNTLNYSNTALNNVVTFDNGNAVITAGDYVLRFNATSGQTRFRYYKSGQQAVQLYKYTTN